VSEVGGWEEREGRIGKEGRQGLVSRVCPVGLREEQAKGLVNTIQR